MRFSAAALPLALLVGCTDVKLPTAAPAAPDAPPGAAISADVSTLLPAPPNDAHPTMVYDPSADDSVPVLTRIEQVMTASLTQVPIPADAFSQQPDAVHPDVACAPGMWNHARCWVTYTPYFNSDPTWENPSFLTMANDTSWQLPGGVTNPVVPYPGAGQYNSDPDQLFDPGSGRLVTFFRLVTTAYNIILATSTGDGRTWTPPTEAFREVNHNAVSPAVVMRPDGSLAMWYVQTGIGCTAATSSVRWRTATLAPGQPVEKANWSSAATVNLNQPGFVVWHMDVVPLPQWHAYAAIMASHSPNNDCASDDLWLGISPDGVNWHTYPAPVLWRGSRSSQLLGVRSWYRTALRYDAATDTLHLWPSALMANGHWEIFHTAVQLEPLIRYLSISTAADQPTSRLRMASKVPIAIRNHMP